MRMIKERQASSFKVKGKLNVFNLVLSDTKFNGKVRNQYKAFQILIDPELLRDCNTLCLIFFHNHILSISQTNTC